MSTTPLGETTPPELFDDQPQSVIFDPNNFLTNKNVQLNPFTSIITIENNERDLDKKIRANPRKTIVIILILPSQSSDDVKTFIRDHILLQQSIHSVVLFFTNGQQREIEMQNLFTSLTIQCKSITDYMDSEIRETLSTAFDLTVKFYSRRMREEKSLGNNGIAFIYERKYYDSVKLQNNYTKSILNGIEND